MPRVTGTMQRARGRRRWARLGIGLSSVLAIAACGSPLAPTSSDVAPDLQPIPLAGVEGFVAFCDLEGASLRVTVLNAGTADAEASSTKVPSTTVRAARRSTRPRSPPDSVWRC
jgi:hypothetical protein